MTSFESERKVFKELIINQSSNTDNDKINLNEKNTVLVKNSLTKVKKGAVLFENKKVKAKLNDKRCHYNQVTREVASMVAEVVVLDKGSGEAIAADIVLNMEETILSVNTFGEKKESLLTEIFLGPYLKHLDNNDEGGRSRPRMDQPEESWRSGGSTFSNIGDNSSWRSRNSDNGDNRSTSWRRGDNSRPKSMLEENREVEHRMAKLALAEIGKQKVRDVAGEKLKKVESEEKIRLRERRKRDEEDKKLKKEKEEEEKIREEEVRIKEEQKKKAEEEENRKQLAERKEKIEEFWVELLPKNLEEGHLLMTEKESEEGWTRQEIFLLNKILCYNGIFFFSLNFL